MASYLIHIAIAKQINKKIKRNYDELIFGSIAPDLSKLLNNNKVVSHFLDNENTDIPNIDKFLEKYKNKLNDDFVMGYFIHLYTDYLWFKYFIPEIYNSETNMITKLDGTVVKCSGRMLCLYIYNDYTNIGKRLIDKYNLDLNVFNKILPQFNNIITEIPMEKLYLLSDEIKKQIDSSKKQKDLIFDITNINTFIKSATELTLNKLNEINDGII